MIHQRESDTAFSEPLNKCGHEPILVADFHGKTISLGNFSQKRNESREEFIHTRKSVLIEIPELQQHRIQFFAETIHRLQEKMEILFAVRQRFFVGDELRHFCREQESRGSFRIPALHGRNRRRAVKRAVHFHGIEFSGVVAQILGRFHSRWIECTFPTSCGER